MTSLVNGKLDVSGSLSVKGTLEKNGRARSEGSSRATDLRVGRKVQGQQERAQQPGGDRRRGGDRKGLKGKSVVIRSGTRCRGALVGERVELGRSALVLANWSGRWAGQSIMMRGIGRMTDAEDVYGVEVVLGRTRGAGGYSPAGSSSATDAWSTR